MFSPNKILITIILSIAAALTISAADKTKILIIEGVSNHDWQHRLGILRSILEKEENFDVDVTVTPSRANAPKWKEWKPNFSNYDVVISGYNDLGVKGGLRWPANVEKDFVSFVRRGGGFMAYHEANNAFPEWTEYNKMIGLGWRDANGGNAVIVNDDESIKKVRSGEGPKTNHGARVNVEVHRRADNNPIYKGLPDSWMAADLEVYAYARGPAKNFLVLTYAREPKTGFNFPIEWATKYGKGKVYVSTYGHVWRNQKQPSGMRCAAHQTILIRAIKWLAGEDPGTSVPDDFPSADKISLRPYTKKEN